MNFFDMLGTCLWLVLEFVLEKVCTLATLVAVGFLLFAVLVRVHTLNSTAPPQLNSFDPKQRIAAVQAAVRQYGEKKQ